MSWKGFKKGLIRLPHQLQRQTGMVASNEHSADEEFSYYQRQFDEFQTLTDKLGDACRKYKDALAALLMHQQQLAQLLGRIYQPISGSRFPSQDGLDNCTSSSSNTTVGNSTFAPFQKHAVELKSADVAADTDIKARLFLEYAEVLTNSLTADLDVVIERQCIQPIHDLAALHKQMVKWITKREHKKLDYDRHYESLRKLREKSADKASGGAEHERKLMKAENTADVAYKEFETINDQLKQRLPPYIQLRVQFIDPILMSLIQFQYRLFQVHLEHSRMLEQAVDMRLSAMDAYALHTEHCRLMLESVPLLSHGLKELPKRTGDLSGSDDGLHTGGSEDDAPASKPHHMSAAAAAPHKLPPHKQPPTQNANPFSSGPSDAPPPMKPSRSWPLRDVNPTSSSTPSTKPPVYPSVTADVTKSTSALSSTAPPPPKPSKPSFLKTSPSTSPSMGATATAAGTATVPMMKQVQPPPTHTTTSSAPKPGPIPQLPPRRDDKKFCQALYDFEAIQPGDLAFRQGDRIEVVEEIDGNWWRGRVVSDVMAKVGVFPSNYVRPLI